MRYEVARCILKFPERTRRALWRDIPVLIRLSKPAPNSSAICLLVDSCSIYLTQHHTFDHVYTFTVAHLERIYNHKQLSNGSIHLQDRAGQGSCASAIFCLFCPASLTLFYSKQYTRHNIEISAQEQNQCYCRDAVLHRVHEGPTATQVHEADMSTAQEALQSVLQQLRSE